MSEPIFKRVDYSLKNLIGYIQMGEIGLPDIQRPFVWRNSKVRDLFDSMYKGYPVGYLLLWQNGTSEDAKAIGVEVKQRPSRLLIVDGQQRLTSLYAVFRGIPVLRQNFQKETIQIAFNPLEERFEVADAAVRRDKSFIPDISRLWAADTDLFSVVENFLERFTGDQQLSDDDIRKVRRSITRLSKLDSFPLTALELSSDIDEEAVSDVFVRINSKGTPLNQADFILTLMSVHWDEGRSQLEEFCRSARTPSNGKPSSFNYYIKPDPDQLLRVGVGVGFKRARLQYVYSLLRGKDLESKKFSDTSQIKQFEILRQAQARVLNLTYWHDFLKCIRHAGFRGEGMISSQSNLFMSYILYIMGRTEFGVDEYRLRNTIARWFFMSALTGRFSGSPESAMEFDLARFRSYTEADHFLQVLDGVCETEMTDDFWNIKLPNDLATSSPRSPSLFAYNAALVLLNARALFSKLRISELLDPSITGTRGAVERHHLFPKAYLAKLGITDIRDTNQIANYAFVEWSDNGKISDSPPSEYFRPLASRFDPSELEQMHYWHSLPQGWESMNYKLFLERRRELMARVIRDGYSILMGKATNRVDPIAPTLAQLLEIGESEQAEFKSTLRINLHTGEKDSRMEAAVIKTIAGFLNTEGGRLLIGMRDDGTPLGIEADRFENEDKMSLHLVNLINTRMGPTAMTYAHIHFDDFEDRRIMIVDCRKASRPVFVKDGNTDAFYIRTGASTTQLTSSQIMEYISQRWK